MRLLIVTDAFPPQCGGSGWSTFHLTKALVLAGHEVRVVKPEPRLEGVRERSYEGIPVSDFGFFFRDLPYLRSFLRDEVLRLRLHGFLVREVSRRPAELIHAQHGISASPSISAARELGIPALVTVRDHWPVCYFTTGRTDGRHCPDCGFSGMLACMKEKSPHAYWAGIPFMPYMRRNMRRKQEWLRRADGVIAVSRYIADHVVRPVVGEAKTHVIPNLIDLEGVRQLALSPARIELPERFVLFVGKLTRAKGALFALDVVSRLQRRLPLVMVGDGPERPVIEERVRREGLDVRMIPWVDNVEVWRIMRRAALIVVPSLGPESLSRTVTEAMAVGAPVAATDRGGIHDQLEHGVSGLILPADPNLFAEAIEVILSDPLQTAHLAKAARERVETVFASDVVIPKMESLYRHLLAMAGKEGLRWKTGQLSR